MTWHRHRWTKWGKPFRYTNMRFLVWYQDRTCTKCDKVDRRAM